MPRACVVLRMSGGLGRVGSRDFVDIGETRIDVFNYGTTGQTATQLQRATHDTMKAMDRDVQGDALLHCAHQSSGPIWLRDPDGDWPLVLETWNVIAAETTAA